MATAQANRISAAPRVCRTGRTLQHSTPRRLLHCVASVTVAQPTSSSSGISGERYVVSDADKALFRKQGFVHLKRVLTEEELQTHVDPVYYRYLRGEIPVVGKDLCDMSGVSGRTPDEYTVYNVMLPRMYFKDWQGNLFEKRCEDIANQLQGGDMAIDYDQILAKRPETTDSIFAWHQDMAYWPPLESSIATATCWLAVTDSTVQNGCMRFVVGSHLEPQVRKHRPVGRSREESHALVTDVDESTEDVVYVPIQRGDITVHNERVVHGSGANRSNSWRNAYVLAYRKKECIAEERRLGFTHSHNDVTSWDVFNKWS